MKIVNPILIYFAGIVGSLKGWLIALSILALLVAFVLFSHGYDCYITERDSSDKQEERDEPDKEKRKSRNKEAKRSLIIGIILIVINTLIPDKETIYTIAVFDTLTVENIQSAGETGKEVIDYVVDQIDRIVNGEEEKE